MWGLPHVPSCLCQDSVLSDHSLPPPLHTSDQVTSMAPYSLSDVQALFTLSLMASLFVEATTFTDGPPSRALSNKEFRPLCTPVLFFNLQCWANSIICPLEHSLWPISSLTASGLMTCSLYPHPHPYPLLSPSLNAHTVTSIHTPTLGGPREVCNSFTHLLVGPFVPWMSLVLVHHPILIEN